jgi:paraquat-inducible protein A
MNEPVPHLLGLRECPDCGLFQQIGRLRPGQVAECERCGAMLRRRRRNSLSTTAALALGALMVLFVAVISPIIEFRLAGQDRTTGLAGLPLGFEEQGMGFLAFVVLMTTMVAPFLRLLMTLLVIVGTRNIGGGGLSRGTLIFMARVRHMLKPWAMIEVFMLGMFVAYTRLAALATVTIGVGLYALGALMVLTAWADCWLDEDALWDAIGRRGHAGPSVVHGRLIGCDICGQVSRGAPGDACPRCEVKLRYRKPQAIGRSWALLITAAILYIPANVYPVMTVIRLGQGSPSTILGGVQELVEVRMWPLALLVLVASVLVPMFKLLGLGTLLVMTQWRSNDRLIDRTRLFRIVDFVGRWSMIDVFMLSILTALVRMGIIASVTPGYGAVAFASVVVLTMLAALSFDPRLMWDAAEAGQRVTEEDVEDGAGVRA